MSKPIFALLAGFIFIFLLSSCNKDNTFTLGQDLISVKTDVITTDTSTVHFYTFKRDSMASNFEKALVGTYTDGNFGTITASTYFEVGLPSSGISDLQNVNNNNAYDSVALTVFYSHYYYGDTNKVYTIEAHLLNDKIENIRTSANNPNGNLFNTTNVPFDPVVLGATSKNRLRPAKKDSIQIRLDDAFGKYYFDTLKNTATQMTNTSVFSNHLKGFALFSRSTNSCVMGYGVADSSMYMKIYYHGDGGQRFLKFSVTNTTYQFNNIKTSWSSTSPMSALTKQTKVVSSFDTQDQVYCQAGTGLMARLEFPYLKRLVDASTNSTSATPNIKILKAELILSPIQGTYNSVSLPSSLLLYQLDYLNNISGILVDNSGNALAPKLTIDHQFNEQTYYTFDVTSFVTSAVQATTNDVPALGISMPSTSTSTPNELYTTLDRLVLGDGNRSLNVSKLKIYFWRY
ncbi:MAG TPA: DUF4270 family protein [Bacteroidales bacterium]